MDSEFTRNQFRKRSSVAANRRAPETTEALRSHRMHQGMNPSSSSSLLKTMRSRETFGSSKESVSSNRNTFERSTNTRNRPTQRQKRTLRKAQLREESLFRRLKAAETEHTHTVWFNFRLLMTVCDLVLLSIAVNHIREHATLDPFKPSQVRSSMAKLMDDVVVAVDLSFVAVQKYYLRREKIKDSWVDAEFGITVFAFIFQMAYWPVNTFLGSSIALKVLAFASLRALKVCMLMKRMREIFTAIMLSYREIAISFLLLVIATVIFTCLALCIFDVREDSYFSGFVNSFVTLIQIFTRHQTSVIMDKAKREDAWKFLQLLVILCWVFIGAIVLANVIIAIMVGAFVKRKEEYDRAVREQSRIARGRKAKKRLMEIFPIFYSQSVERASKDPYFLPMPELIEEVQEMMNDYKNWKRTWGAALKYLPDIVEETVWSAQIAVYYESSLSCMQGLLTESKFLCELAQDVAVASVAQQWRQPNPVEYESPIGSSDEDTVFD